MKFRQWGLGIALLTFGTGSVLATAFDDKAQLEARLEQLQEDLESGISARMDAYRAATTDTQKVAAQSLDVWAKLDERARALADEADGTEVAAQVWSMVFTNADKTKKQDDIWEAYWILIEDYTSSPALVGVVDNVQYTRNGRDQAVEGLRQLLELDAPVRTQAASMMSLAKLLESNPATKVEATELLRTLQAKFPKATNPRGQTYSSLAKASLFEADKLQVGMHVPDFTSIDETKTAFKISDYEGKVMLLDFWAFW